MTPASLWKRLIHLIRQRRGSIAMIAALCAPVLVVAAGFAVDFSYASYINQRLSEAADAAVLTAVSQSAATSVGGYSKTAKLQTYGLNVFQGNIANLSVPVTPNLTVVSNATGGVVATLSYTANVPTFFSGIFGIPHMTVSNTVSATANPTVYINYYIVVDVSQSMGIGSTAADMQALYDRTKAANNTTDGEPGCVFGCHVPLAGQTQSTEYLAHNVSPKITLRVDAAVSAIQNIVSAAQASAGSQGNIKIGLYTMSQDPTVATPPYINTVAALSSDYSLLTTEAAAIDLGNNTAGGIGDTNFPSQLSSFNNLILTANGTGATASSPLNYVFIITDGVEDTYSAGCTDTHCTAVFDASQCTPLKTKATVGVIYTTYLPIYYANGTSGTQDAAYSALVNPFAANIAPALQACASSSTYYYEASDGPAITTGMDSLFASSEEAARLLR
jgi:Flp pilus assembly protein TadG